MSRRLTLGAALAGAGVMFGLALAFASGSVAAGGKADDDTPARLLVTAREYDLSLSRQKIEAGQAIVQLYDFGEDPHDLVVQRVGGARAFGIGEVLPGETGELRFRTKRTSTYQLWCSLEDHRALGMEATLRTSRR